MTPISSTRIKKAFAFLTAIIFSSSTVLAQVSAPQNLIGNLDLRSSQIALARSLDIPQETGEVSSIFIPQNSEQKPFLFHIQDIHANESAQKKIDNILDVLSNNYGVESFGFEGANSKLMPSVLHFADNPETNFKIANYLVAKGQLTGGEFFALKKAETSADADKFRFEGIENGAQYMRDLKIFRQGLSNKESIDDIIKSIQLRIDRYKSAIFNRELSRFDKIYQSYENREEKNLLSIYKEVQSKAKSVLGLDLLNVRNQEQYPQMVRMANLISLEKSVRSEQVQLDIKRIQDSLKGSSAAKKDAENFRLLLEKLNNNQMADCAPYASWRECFESLRAFMGSNHLKWMDYPSFRLLAMRLILQEEMMSVEMFEELNGLIYEIEMKMADEGSAVQKEIIELAHDVKLLNRFLSLEASRSDVDEVRSENISLIDSIKARLSSLEQSEEDSWVGPEESNLLFSQYELANLFYQGARKRETAFVDRVLEMSKNGNHRVAFVTGGYHTQGIREELERRGVAYATITPKLSSDETTMVKEFSKLYEQGMLGTQSNIFEKSKIVDVLKEVSITDYVALGGRERDRVQEFMEAIIQEGIPDLVKEIREDDQSIDKLDEIAPALQEKLRKNEALAGEKVEVQAGDGSLRFSWRSRLSGHPLPSEGLMKLVNALNQVPVAAPQAVQPLVKAASLGVDDERMTRLEFIKRMGRAALLAAVAGVTACAKKEETPTVSGGLPVLDLSQVALVDDNQTSNLSTNQPATQGKPEQLTEASVTGGSTPNTKVTKKTGKSFALNFDHNSGKYSGITFSRNNFDDNNGAIPANVTVDDFMDANALQREFVINLEKLKTVEMGRLKLEFLDDTGNKAVWELKNINWVDQPNGTSQKATVRLRLDATNFQSNFNLRRFSANLISDNPDSETKTYSGELTVIVQGAEGLYSTRALPAVLFNETSLFANPVVRNGTPTPQAIMAPIAGASKFNDVQFKNAQNGITEVTVRAVSGQYGGTALSANRNLQGGIQQADLMDGTGLPGRILKLNHNFTGADLPDQTILEIISTDPVTKKKVRFRTLVEDLTAGQKSIQIDMNDPNVNPDGFQVDNIEAINTIYQVRNAVTPVTKNIKSEIQAQGYSASEVVSVGTAFDDADVSNLGGAIFVATGSTQQTQVSGTVPTYNAVIQTNAAGQTSGFEFRGNFNITSAPIRINLQQTAGVVGNLPTDFQARFIDGSGRVAQVALPVIFGTNVPGDKLGYTIFTNYPMFDQAGNSINKSDIRTIQFVYVGDGTPRSGAQSVTANSLGAQQFKFDAADDERAIRDSVLASPDLADGIWPLVQKIMLRYPEFSQVQILDMVEKYSKEVLDTLPPVKAKPIVTKIERALERLRAANNSFAVIEQGYGLQIEMIGDKVPSQADIASIIANLKLHPQLFVRMVYTGTNQAEALKVVLKIRNTEDFTNQNIGIRFDIVLSSDPKLKQDLAALPSQIFKAMNQSTLSVKPKSQLQLAEHTTVLASDSAVQALPMAYTNSIKVVNDVTDVDMPVVRVASGHMAVKSFAGLAPELQATILKRTLNASDFLSARLEALQNEIKAVIAVLIAA